MLNIWVSEFIFPAGLNADDASIIVARTIRNNYQLPQAVVSISRKFCHIFSNIFTFLVSGQFLWFISAGPRKGLMSCLVACFIEQCGKPGSARAAYGFLIASGCGNF